MNTFKEQTEGYSEQYKKLLPSIMAHLQVDSIDEIVFAEEFLEEQEEVWDLPTNVHAELTMNYVETLNFSIGYVAFAVSDAGVPYVFECNASPYLIWKKK